MRITKAPYRKSGYRSTFLYACSDGNEYTLAELAEKTSITKETIKKRINSWGMFSDKVLEEGVHGKQSTKFNAADAMQVMIDNDKTCPIMQGSTNLRITRKAWRTACSFHRERPMLNDSRYPSNRFCAKCKGEKVPKGVDFITLKEIEEFKKSHE